MKVMMIINSSYGLYAFRRELVEALIDNGNSVTIVAGWSERIKFFKELGCEVEISDFDSHGTNPIKEIPIINYYRKIIVQQAPDVVLTYTIKPNIYAGIVCASLGIKYIANVTGLGTAVENKGVLQNISVSLYKYALRKCKMVFFQNRSNMQFMLSHKIIGKDNVDLLPGSGVNLQQFRLLDYPKDATVRFVFISRIMKEKGIDQFIEAARKVKSEHDNVEFHICGGCNSDYESIVEQEHISGTIIYHGKVSDVREIHLLSSCTIHPSYYPEGMSNVLLESCACGRPIITTNRPGCGEIVDDGINGFIVKEMDSMDLINKIEKFLSLNVEERRNMGLAGRRKVEKEFDRQIVIDKYLKEIL